MNDEANIERNNEKVENDSFGKVGASSLGVQSNMKKDSIEVPVGKFFGKLRDNPWVLSTLVLGLVLFIVVIAGFGKGGSVISGNVISENDIGDNLIGFINSQGQGTANLVSVEREGELYQVTVDFEGQEIPVFVTLDGKFLVVDPIPLNDPIPVSDTSNNLDDNSVNVGDIVDVEVGDSPVKGNEDAKVTIVEFSDYECPFCGKFYSETLSLIEDNYIKTGKVKLVFMDFPLSFHPNAQKAAEAARCAGDQKGDESYFKMHDKLFENQQALNVDSYKKWAKEQGLNSKKFDECLDSGKYFDAVQADLAYGSSIGVTGTPGFFVNGKLISGAQPYSVFEAIIEAELSSEGEFGLVEEDLVLDA